LAQGTPVCCIENGEPRLPQSCKPVARDALHVLVPICGAKLPSLGTLVHANMAMSSMDAGVGEALHLYLEHG